jgi:phage/plasmid-associated DNA primase
MSGNLVYDENEIIDYLYKKLKLGEWWRDLLVFNDNGEVDVEKSTETISWSDIRTAKIIGEKFGSCLSYVELIDKWYAWNGIIHVPCEGTSTVRKLLGFYATAVEYALEHIESVISSKADAIRKEQMDKSEEEAKKTMGQYVNGYKKHRAFRDKLNSNAGIISVVAAVRTEVAISSKYYENDHDWFVMRNCVMDLKKFKAGEEEGVLVPHDPSRPVTRYFDADYSYNNLGHWDKFLESSLPVEAIRNYVQQVFGAAFMGTSKSKVIINAIGKKDSGKSILLGAFHDLCQGGAGYVAMPDALSIMKVQGQNFSQDAFRGQRVVAISEPDENQVPDTAFLKRFSGDDLVETSNKFAKMVGWKPQGILFIAANNFLKINIRDAATVERIKLVEFPNQFLPAGPGVPEELTMIPDIADRIKADRDRVLMWVIEGMVAFRNNSFVFDEPAEVAVSQDQFVENSSTAFEWFNDMVDNEFIKYDLDTPLSQCLSVADAFTAYMIWCKAEANNRPMSRKYFVLDLVSKYGETKRSSGIRFPGFCPTNTFKLKYTPESTGYLGNM